ncbi:MAG: helix-turn-helix domain-containing protein [Lachnospiraceae bacterium]|nr:helix-turn-helix domain-containing protein [Lachnospiraceae bacterium]
MSFSERLKQARIRSGYTQQQVADLMEITNSTYCGYETGKRQPDVAKIKMLSKILKISGDFLLETGYEEKEVKSKDPQLEKIIHCYNEMDDVGREFLADQAEYWLEKHPRAKEKEA